jgi:hypothetical protein
VAEHHRPATVAEHAVGQVDVGVADTGRGDAHQDLTGAWRIELDRLDPDRAAGLA